MIPISNHIAEHLGRRIRSAWRSFASEEAGLSTVEMLLLLFIGVVIIVTIIAFFWNTIWPTVMNIINNLFAQNQGPT